MTVQQIRSHLYTSILGAAERIGPFQVTLATDTDNVFRNYAVPDPAAAPTDADVTELCAWFRQHRRRPRLEIVLPAPEVTEALLRNGFRIERELPLMLLETLVVPPVPGGVSVDLVSEPDDLRACAAVQNSAYGAGDPTDADLARLIRLATSGGAVALARVDGEPASSGVLTVPQRGLAELAAIGTLEPFRRRGLASAVAAALSLSALDSDVTPYLQAEGEDEARMYRRLGFQQVGALALVNGPQ